MTGVHNMQISILNTLRNIHTKFYLTDKTNNTFAIEILTSSEMIKFRKYLYYNS